MKYIAYCRKSSEDDSRQVQSLETQETALKEYALKNSLEVVEVLKESRSARTDNNRPLFNKMLNRIQSGEVKGIIVHHIDRLSRNGIESGKITKLFEAGLIKEIRTPSKVISSIQEMLYMDFDFVFASHYSRNLSIRAKEGIATKLRNGEYPGKTPPGYLNRDKKIIVDPIRSVWIKKAFEMYASGAYALREVTEYLFEKGLRSKYTNRKIPKSNIHNILKNPFYYGAILSKGKLYSGKHEPLIKKSLFDQVQEVFTGKKRSQKQKHDFLYRSFLICDVCGCMMTATVKKGKYIYYYCTNGKKNCSQHLSYLSEDYVKKMVQEVMNGLTLDKEMAELSLQIYLEEQKEDLKRSENNKEYVNSRISETNSKLDRLLDMFLSGSIDQTTYSAKQKSLQQEKVSLEVALKESNGGELQNTLELLDEIKNRGCSLGEMFKTKDFIIRRDLLNSVLWNLQIRDGEIASQRLKLPYAYFEKVAKNPEIDVWLGDRDSNPDSQIQILKSYR